MMEGSEELREAVVTLRRENDLLRTAATHSSLLLKALDAVLCVDGDDDPFAGVFSALMPVFEYSHVIVLIEQGHEKKRAFGMRGREYHRTGRLALDAGQVPRQGAFGPRRNDRI